MSETSDCRKCGWMPAMQNSTLCPFCAADEVRDDTPLARSLGASPDADWWPSDDDLVWWDATKVRARGPAARRTRSRRGGLKTA